MTASGRRRQKRGSPPPAAPSADVMAGAGEGGLPVQLAQRINRISLGKMVWGVELLDPQAHARWKQHDWIGSALELYN